MSESLKSFTRDKKENIMLVLQVCVIPVFFWFDARISTVDARINTLERPNSGIEQRLTQLEKKQDQLIEKIDKMQEAQMQFYKDYSPALEYSKRQLEKK